jgi:hypothetical protein
MTKAVLFDFNRAAIGRSITMTVPRHSLAQYRGGVTVMTALARAHCGMGLPAIRLHFSERQLRPLDAPALRGPPRSRNTCCGTARLDVCRAR